MFTVLCELLGVPGVIKEKGRQWLYLFIVITLIVPLGTVGLTSDVQAEEQPDIDAKSYVLMDAESGSILLAKEADTPLPPASMTKMMTEYLVLAAIEDGTLSWEQEVTVSTNASKIEGSQVWLAENEVRTVKELFTAMSVYSANDATVALAEEIAGSETAFVGMMNEKAKEMGMSDTHFRNSTGLPQEMYPDPPQVDGKHLMSAKDSAILAKHLITDFPDITEFTTIDQATFRDGEPGAIDMINWNRMIKGLEHEYDGVDGLKTGETDAAGACFTGTAVRDDMRLITVVMGTDSRAKRFQETKKLLDYGFNNYEIQQFVKGKATIPQHETVEVTGGKKTEVQVITAKNVNIAVKKDAIDQYEAKVTFKEELKAPIKAGDIVGDVTYLHDGKPIANMEPVPLLAAEDVDEAGWFRLFFRGIKDVVSGIFSSIVDSITGIFSK